MSAEETSEVSAEAKLKSAEETNTFYKCAETFEGLEAIIRDYEIKHIVRFTCHRGYKEFNAQHEPWSATGQQIPKLMWGSDLVPCTNKPYVSVARKTYGCQYGKQRHGKRLKVNSNFPSYKIGCPCQIDMIEVLRLVNPQVKISDKGMVTKYSQRELSLHYRDNIKKYMNGERGQLQWKREFHMSISPLSAHTHAIGERAAEHQRIDPIILNRIHELAASGITASDVIRDNMVHYVEEVMFKDKEPPLKSNRRFYPNSRDIRNHVYIVKASQLEKHGKSAAVVSELEGVVASVAENSTVFTGSIVEESEQDTAAEYISADTYQQQEFQQSEQYSYTSNGYSQYTVPSKQQPYSQVCSYSTVTTSEKTPPKGDSKVAITTTRPFIKSRLRNPKDKFLSLVKKLYRVANAIESHQNLNKLSASIINVIMEAKTMLPEDKLGVLYEEEPRTLLYPRRIRTHKKKKPLPPRQRYPDINPEATKIPDKKTLKAEAKKKAAEARMKEAKKAADLRAKKGQLFQDRERTLIGLPVGSPIGPTMKRQIGKLQTAGSGVTCNLPGNEGQPPPKVLIMTNPAKTPGVRMPVVVQRKGQTPIVQQFVISPSSSTNSNVQTVMLSPSTQPLVGAVKVDSSKLVGAVKVDSSKPFATTIVGTRRTPLQSLGVVTESKSTSKYSLVKYSSILPKQVLVPVSGDVTANTLSNEPDSSESSVVSVIPSTSTVVSTTDPDTTSAEVTIVSTTDSSSISKVVVTSKSSTVSSIVRGTEEATSIAAADSNDIAESVLHPSMET